jgi:hypothetical protein
MWNRAMSLFLKTIPNGNRSRFPGIASGDARHIAGNGGHSVVTADEGTLFDGV